jgi:malonyl-CoA/methylmalonyl-CoA synthetase
MASGVDRLAWTKHLPSGVRPDRVDLLADASLPGRWTRRWAERPSWRQLRDVDGRWISSDELEHRTRTLAARLQTSGLVPGERIVLSAATSAELVVAYIAALRAGLVVVPLNTAYTEAEVKRIVHAARPAAAAVDDDRRRACIAAASEGATVVYGIELEQELAGSVAAEATVEVDAARSDDPALLVYTSGTTGQPKGALLTHGNLLASATAVNLAWRWATEDCLLLTLPLFHVHGLGVGLNGSLSAGGAIVLRAKFDASDVAEQSAGGVSLFFGVPAMYQRLATNDRASALGRMRLLVSGSAPLPAALAEEVARQAGQIPLERYGMTETVMLTSNPYEGERRPGTVGFPLPGVELRLANAGEVEVRGPNVIAGYHENPGANADAFTGDGWFRTGDLGELDPDGYLRLVGRSKDLIITGGYNVHPREVEEALATHPDVVEVAVVGRPSEEWGEQVTAVVVAKRAFSVDELRAHASLQLAPYKLPRQVEFVDELPRNALGKVLRSQLQDAQATRGSGTGHPRSNIRRRS